MRPGHLSDVFEDAAVRCGLYTGLSLSVIFTTWLFLANRMPMLQGMALPRNVIAATLLGVIGGVPVVRFFRSPTELLVAGVLSWGIFALTYRAWCLKFGMLDQYYSTSQVFVLGTLVYVLLATLCWLGTIIWRVRATDSSHSRH